MVGVRSIGKWKKRVRMGCHWRDERIVASVTSCARTESKAALLAESLVWRAVKMCCAGTPQCQGPATCSTFLSVLVVGDGQSM